VNFNSAHNLHLFHENINFTQLIPQFTVAVGGRNIYIYIYCGLIHEDDDGDNDENLNTLGGETLWTGTSYIGCTVYRKRSCKEENKHGIISLKQIILTLPSKKILIFLSFWYYM
jgi:hypothetical protein